MLALEIDRLCSFSHLQLRASTATAVGSWQKICGSPDTTLPAAQKAYTSALSSLLVPSNTMPCLQAGPGGMERSVCSRRLA